MIRSPRRTITATRYWLERVKQALQAAGLDKPDLDWSELAPLDQFHLLGLAATRELAARLDIETGAAVLDVGCGLGGPARYLAATYGCRVTGIDLSQSFVDVARMLTERVGLSSLVAFRRADALDLPFADRGIRPRVDLARRDEHRRPRTACTRTFTACSDRAADWRCMTSSQATAGPCSSPCPWARQQAEQFPADVR